MVKLISIILCLLFNTLYAQITLDETTETIDVDGGSTHVTGTVTGGTDKTFVHVVVIRGSDSVTGVPSGGSLTWTEQVDGCTDNSQHGIHVFTAQGTASSFTVTTTLSGITATILSQVLVFSGVDTGAPFEDAHWSRMDDASPFYVEGTADPGTCPVAASQDTVYLNQNNTAADSWFISFFHTRNKTITGGDTGLTNKNETTGGAGGDNMHLYSYATDRGASTGNVLTKINISGTTEVLGAGIIIQEASAAAPRRVFIID